MSDEKNSYHIIKIIDLRTVSFKMEDEPTDNAAANTFSFNIRTSHLVEESIKRINVACHLEVSEAGKQAILSELTIVLTFEIGEFEKYKISGHNIPDELRKMLHGVSISTSRGVLHSKLAGTYLQKAIVPIVDPNTMVPELPAEKVNPEKTT